MGAMDNPFIEIQKPGYRLVIQVSDLDEIDQENDNIDIKVYFADGRSYSATLFTLKNIRSLMKRYKDTGECLSGLYFYAADMVIVERLTIEVIERVVDGLIESGEYTSALRSLNN